MSGHRPIGWWVRRLDDLLEQVVEKSVASDGLTRRHWQALHDLASGQGDEAGLRESLAPFAGPDDVGTVIRDLEERGWVERGPALTLTAPGRAAHDRLLVQVTAMRRRVTDGLSEEEYAAAVSALQRMVANVEQALSATPGDHAAPGSRPATRIPRT